MHSEVPFAWNSTYLAHFIDTVCKIISIQCIHLYALSEILSYDRSLGTHFQTGYAHVKNIYAIYETLVEMLRI